MDFLALIIALVTFVVLFSLIYFAASSQILVTHNNSPVEQSNYFACLANSADDSDGSPTPSPTGSPPGHFYPAIKQKLMVVVGDDVVNPEEHREPQLAQAVRVSQPPQAPVSHPKKPKKQPKTRRQITPPVHSHPQGPTSVPIPVPLPPSSSNMAALLSSTRLMVPPAITVLVIFVLFLIL